MINRLKEHKTIFFVVILLVLLLLTGCDGKGQKSRKPPGDFSRGLPLSVEAIGPVSADISPDGNLIHVMIPTQNQENQPIFQYLQIDPAGKIIMDKKVELGLALFVRSPKMVYIGEELHLVWASRESTVDGWDIWHAIINTDAEVTSPPKTVSAGTERVSQFSITGDEGGNITVVWEDSNSHSLHLTRISNLGKVITPPVLLVTNGELPALIAADGTLHISWMEEGQLLYAQMDEGSSLPLEGIELTYIQVAVGNRMDGPVIGIADGSVYLFWSILRQVGLEAGTAITEYLIFPIGKPAQARRAVMPILPVSEDFLQPYQGSLALSQSVPAPREEYMTTDNILDPQTLTKPSPGAQIVAVSASQIIRLDAHMQIMLGIFEKGVYQSYTIGTKTTEISQNPYIGLDDAGNLHLIWQEGHSGNRVYYATTAPLALENLDKVALADFPNLILAGGLEALTGIMLFPFAFPWMAIGLVIMIGLRLARNDEDVTQPLSKVLVILALLAYQISKLLFLPDILVYIPFSAWLDIPEGIGRVFRVVVPIIIVALGIIAAEWRRRSRTESPTSSLGYYMTAVLVDTVLTLSIYGVIFLGEY